MKSEYIELSLDMLIWLITSITELGEPCLFGVWVFNVVVHMVQKNGEESAKKGTELISSPQPQGLSGKAESVTIRCPWKGHFGWRGMETFEVLLLCMTQHLPAHLEQSSHFIPKWFPRTQHLSQESVTSQLQQVLDAFFFMGHWPLLFPLMWNKATPSLMPPGSQGDRENGTESSLH